MNGIISGMDYSLLFSSSGSSASQESTAILTALYSGASNAPGSTTFVSTGNPLTDLKLAQLNQPKAVAKEALQPQVARTLKEFTTAIGNAKTIQAALNNPAVQQVLLTANGLSNYIGETALVQKILLSDSTDPKSLVNKLGDEAWLITNQTYNFAKNGLAELQNPKVMATLSNAYAEVEWRSSLDQATPGLSNALTFLGQASSIKSSADILDSVTNFDVITTALGIPLNIVNQDISAQKAAINSRLDYARLQDPKYVTSLTDQYLLTMQEQSSSSSSSSSTGLLV